MADLRRARRPATLLGGPPLSQPGWRTVAPATLGSAVALHLSSGRRHTWRFGPVVGNLTSSSMPCIFFSGNTLLWCCVCESRESTGRGGAAHPSLRPPVPPASCQDSIYVLFLRKSTADEGGQEGGDTVDNRSNVATPQPSPHMAVAPATRRDVAAHGPSAGSGGGAEARAPIRRRRAHSHQPGLYSDKWGASCPDGGAEARGPRPPSEGWRSWSYEAGPAADTASARSVLPCMHLPAATPQPSPTRPSRQRPPRGKEAPCPQVDADTALLEVIQRAPTGSNPLLAYLRKTPPGPTGPARDPDRSQSKEDHPTASARVPSPGNNCCFTPRPASRDDKKTQSNLTQGD